MSIMARRGGRLSDKWMQYITIYEREIGPLRALNRPLRLLEIGVQNGGSLETWREYLPTGSRIVGIDIDPKCADLTFKGDTTVVIADSGDPEALAAAAGPEEFDVIIDDGSHQQTDILNGLEVLWGRLAAGGVYIIEDLHCAYWGSHGGGFRSPSSAVEHLKRYVDALHVDHYDLGSSAPESEQSTLLSLSPRLARISFYDSVAVLEKYPDGKHAPFPRVISGEEMGVTDPAPLAAAVAVQRDRFVFSDKALHALDTPLAQALERVAQDRAAALADAQAQVTARSVELAEAQTGRAAAAHSAELLAAANSTLTAELQARRDLHRESQAALAHELADTKDRLSAIAAERDAATAASLQAAEKLKAASVALEETREELRDASERSAAYQVELVLLRNASTTATTEIAALRERLAAEAANGARLRSVLSAGETEIERLREMLHEEQSTVAALRETLETEAAERTSLREGVSAREAEIGRLREALAAKEQAEVRAAAERDALEQRLSDAQTQASAAADEMANLRARLAADVHSLRWRLAAPLSSPSSILSGWLSTK